MNMSKTLSDIDRKVLGVVVAEQKRRFERKNPFRIPDEKHSRIKLGENFKEIEIGKEN